MEDKYRSGRYNITGDDLLRVEKKLNSALNEKLHSKAENYAKAKIRNLQNFLDDADRETDSYTVEKSTKRRDPIGLLQETEEKYVTGLEQIKKRNQQLEIETKEYLKTIEALKDVLQRERTERDQFLDTIETEHSTQIAKAT